MKYDPRNPDAGIVIPTDSTIPMHSNLRKTLVLLRIDAKDAPIYFVVEGLATWPKPLDEMISGEEYFYNEHTCPANFIRIPMVSAGGDHDPHGIFAFVDAIWMTTEYVEATDSGSGDEYLIEAFPQMVSDARKLGDDVTVEQLYQAFRARIIEDLEVEAGDDQGAFAGPRLRFRG